MNKKDNTLFYVLAVILVFVLISWMKDRNKSDTKNTTTEKEPDLVDPVTGDNVYLPNDYDPVNDAPPVVAGGGITATVPDNQQTVSSDNHTGVHFAQASYTL